MARRPVKVAERTPGAQASAAQPPAASEAARSPRLRPLLVRVVHGDLRHAARYPLVVGHYQDDTIAGVEALVDEQVGGRLSKRYRLGVYPGQLGSADVVRVPGQKHRAALVIGLGRVGDLAERLLAEAVTRGVLRYAAEAGERDAAGRSVALSFLLIGSHSPGLTIEESVLGIVRGVTAANRALRSAGAEPLPDEERAARGVLIRKVEFVEIYEDRAEAAARALCDLTTRFGLGVEPGEIEVATHLRTKAGARSALPHPADAWQGWRRILVSEADGGLRFVTLSDSARVEGSLAGADRANIEHYVRAIAGRTAWDAEAAATLFHLILPNTLKPRVSIVRDLVLVFQLGRAEAKAASQQGARAALPATDYPWELICERTGRQDGSADETAKPGQVPTAGSEQAPTGEQTPATEQGQPAGAPDKPVEQGRVEPLAVRVGLVRQLRVDDVREAPPPRGRHVLVIGDPRTDASPELPAAQTEAKAVAEKLRGHCKVELLVQPYGRSVIDALFRREWLALHVAGHGVYKPDDRESSGVVLSHGLCLTAGEIHQLPVVPSLVFLNCCSVGRLDPHFHPSLAASLAEQLIRRGVRAVVVAGWVVDDTAALTFAKTFYDEMTSGRSFGQALLQARRKTHREHRHLNTWGAYQAYGDPGFVLCPESNDEAHRLEERVVSRRDLRSELKAFGDGKLTGEAGDRLLERLKRAPKEWREDAGLLEAAGDACKKAGRFEQAVKFYEDAVAAPSGEVSVRAVQQLVNLRVRILARDGDHAAARELGRALERLDHLLALAPSSEAWCLRGSALKRLAVAAGLATARRGVSVREVLESAAEAYGRAERLAPRDPYPRVNRATIQILLGQADIDKNVRSRLEAVVASQRTQRRPAASLWARVGPVDAAAALWLARGAALEEAAELEASYREVRGDAADGDFTSVVEQLEWIAAARRALRARPPVTPSAHTTASTLPSLDERLATALRAIASGSSGARRLAARRASRSRPPRPPR